MAYLAPQVQINSVVALRRRMQTAVLKTGVLEPRINGQIWPRK